MVDGFNVGVAVGWVVVAEWSEAMVLSLVWITFQTQLWVAG